MFNKSEHVLKLLNFRLDRRACFPFFVRNKCCSCVISCVSLFMSPLEPVPHHVRPLSSNSTCRNLPGEHLNPAGKSKGTCTSLKFVFLLFVSHLEPVSYRLFDPTFEFSTSKSSTWTPLRSCNKICKQKNKQLEFAFSVS